EVTRVEPRPFLIVEGILALHSPAIRELLDIKVFVHTDEQECLRRRLERDIAERGRTHECVMRQYEETVRPMAQLFVLPSRECADVVVSGEEPLDQSIAAVLAVVSRASRSTSSSVVATNQI